MLLKDSVIKIPIACVVTPPLHTFVEGEASFGSYSTVVESTQSVNMVAERETKPERAALHPVSAAGAPQPEVTGIFGTGDLGRSLG